MAGVEPEHVRGYFRFSGSGPAIDQSMTCTVLEGFHIPRILSWNPNVAEVESRRFLEVLLIFWHWINK